MCKFLSAFILPPSALQPLPRFTPPKSGGAGGIETHLTAQWNLGEDDQPESHIAHERSEWGCPDLGD
ncbi:MAG TPA: hypothetical protein VNK49_11635 [Anaerolineales bacterium]|nr:hypothetical protein [Anaerolineales bacterium]